MADITVTYKGSTIGEISASGSHSINTAGKYCEADIGISYTSPGGGYSISAVFTQGSDKFFTTDDLEALRENLVVTAYYSDNTSEVITEYSLSGTLTAGVSTITVTALDLTTTFSVTVTAATDVTPSLTGFSATGNAATVFADDEAKTLLVSSTSGAYRGAYKSFTFENGARYRFTGHIDYFSGTCVAGWGNSSGGMLGTGYRTEEMMRTQDFSIDCIPSESGAYSQSGRISFYCAYTTSGAGRALFSNLKVIKYSDADPNQVLNVLMGGETV